MDAESETLLACVEVAPTLRSGGNRTGGDRPPGTDVDTCETLIPVAAGAHPPAIGFYANDSGNDAGDDVSPTLRSMEGGGGNHPAVAFQASQSGMREVDSHATLDGNNGSRRHNGVRQGLAVRRLTPRECERLQGVPDDFTAIPGAADGPRYKALGNGMALPVVRWIGLRILAEVSK